MKSQEVKKHYKDITFGENRVRLKLLIEFRDLVIKYFDNSRLNMLSGNYIEKPEGREARDAINLILNRAYKIIRLADIKTSITSTASLAAGRHGKNIDLILNIFNLGRNDIPPNTAIDYIERAIEVYKSNRLLSLMRTINPFYWMTVILNYMVRGFIKDRTCKPR